MILLLHVITLIQSALGKQVSHKFLSFLNELLNAKGIIQSFHDDIHCMNCHLCQQCQYHGKNVRMHGGLEDA